MRGALWWPVTAYSAGSLYGPPSRVLGSAPASSSARAAASSPSNGE
jgi:hypothetical protein